VVTAALAHVAVRTPAAPVHTRVKRVTASRVAPARPAVRTVPKRTPRHAQRVRAAEPVHDLLLSAAVGTAPFAVAPRGAAFWESVALPDPIPAALRLDPAFAKRLNETSARAGVDWALVLGVARAAGGRSASPVAPAALAALGAKLASLGAGADEWAAARAYGHADTFADTAVALAHYNRAVGLDALVHGLAAQKLALETRVLADPRVTIYAGGRDDVVQGHVDVRVLAVIEYMAETYGQVSISSLISGHREFARPGVVSAHVYGRALDIASVDGVAIYGHQQRGSITERAVKALLLLPAEVEPAQIISLIGLGGPSFSLADHYDHIHVGF
jgi:hypothetical protein